MTKGLFRNKNKCTDAKSIFHVKQFKFSLRGNEIYLRIKNEKLIITQASELNQLDLDLYLFQKKKQIVHGPIGKEES